MSEIDLTKVNLNWCMNILNRIDLVLKSDTYTDQEKLIAVQWLIKQAFKNNSED